MDNSVGQTQSMVGTVQVPNYSGVNIQIFNPAVGAPGATLPQSTVNAPTYTYATNPGACYPPNYYTQNLANGANSNQNVAGQTQDSKNNQTAQDSLSSQNTNSQSSTQTNSTTETAKTSQVGKKMKEVEVVELTDDYIKTLEGYLNNSNKDIRLMAGKDVVARFSEDKTRKNDPALNALLNKMLQDPYQPVKFLAMSTLDAKLASGDEKTVKLLQGIQQTNSNKIAEKDDPVQASSVLLQMAGPRTKKLVESDENDTKSK